MNRRFFAEFLTVLSVQNVDPKEVGSEECLIGDVLVRLKVLKITFPILLIFVCKIIHYITYIWLINSSFKQDVLDGGMVIDQKELQRLQNNGVLTLSRTCSRRPSAIVIAPSLVSLNDKNIDILGDLDDEGHENEEEKKIS